MTKSKQKKKKMKIKRQQQTSYSKRKKIESAAQQVDVVEPEVMPKERIIVHQLVTPMRYNRASFQAASEGIREESLNYYLPTSILKGVKNILGFASYSAIKAKLNRGEFTTPKEVMPPKVVNNISPQVYLSKTMDKTKIDYMYDEEGYMICEPFEVNELDKWAIIHYLYRTYSLDGFADMTVDGISYKVRNEPISGWNANLVIAIQGDHLIMGNL